MEFIHSPQGQRSKIKAALFDFDGTLSTLRRGWEEIMEPLMLEMISGGREADEALIAEVRRYIDQSTGIQTYYQMKWLAETVKRYGHNAGASEDPWWYKNEYNNRLMNLVGNRKASIFSGEKTPEDFLVKGSEDFLQALTSCGVEIYVASGTDDPDVKEEAKVLGLDKYFKEIAGAPHGKADCSKEAVLRQLIGKKALKGPEVVVIGDGKVEIALGREVNALTIGIASDEDARSGINPVKKSRLTAAGAHVIIGDFENVEGIMDWLELHD